MKTDMKTITLEKRIERLETLVELLMRERDERELNLTELLDVTAEPRDLKKLN